MVFEFVGAGCFGLVIGWITYRTLRRKERAAALSDLAAVLGVVGGGVVTALYPDPGLFAAYSIGLAVGFFAYLLAGLRLGGTERTDGWMGD
jgi:NhaP-type Na+/H+ or K+/H+ antiporter